MADPRDLLPAVVLGGAVLLWVAGFDIIYACQDVDFDRAAGAAQHSGARGRGDALATGGGCATWATIVLLAGLPLVYPLPGLDLLDRRGRGRGASGLRALAGPAGRFDARERGVFSTSTR